MTTCAALLVAAPASGQGKTTVTAALARLHTRDDLADEHRLAERGGSTDDAEHDDEAEHASLLEDVGEEFAELCSGAGRLRIALSAA